MDFESFRRHGHALVDRMADYLETVERLRVTPDVQPGAIRARLAADPPEDGEPFERILADFDDIVLPGMTHWQHPSFFGYFPANSSPPSVLAEMLTATLGAQCMSWLTSPAAAELEEVTMGWLGRLIGLPDGFTGVIQDTASTATLCAILCARERASADAVNRSGRAPAPLVAYCSAEAHSSVTKAARIAGIGDANLRLVPVDARFAMRPEALAAAVAADRAAGRIPFCVVATVGTTASTALDPLRPIGNVCREAGAWLHVDAAYAGSAMVAPELRWMIDGVEFADSLVFNPHKWLFTNFDCSAYFVRDVARLVRTFEIHPEYLKTPVDKRVNNYRDWGIPLGRRFRALKLWFVLRSYGAEGLRRRIRAHLAMARWFAAQVEQNPDFEILAPTPLAVVAFRWHPRGVDDPERLDALNADLLARLNATGKLFMSHARLGGAYALRMSIGQTYTEQRHVEAAWSLIRATAEKLVI
jgi:aromatic-L-amino-acid decarboxylase